MVESFTAIPILALSRARDPATKPQFLQDLRHALLNVGFLYLSETGLPAQLVQQVIRECAAFFEELPWAEKEAIEMKHQKSFLGWSRVSGMRDFFSFCCLVCMQLCCCACLFAL